MYVYKVSIWRRKRPWQCLAHPTVRGIKEPLPVTLLHGDQRLYVHSTCSLLQRAQWRGEGSSFLFRAFHLAIQALLAVNEKHRQLGGREPRVYLIYACLGGTVSMLLIWLSLSSIRTTTSSSRILHPSRPRCPERSPTRCLPSRSVHPPLNIHLRSEYHLGHSCRLQPLLPRTPAS